MIFDFFPIKIHIQMNVECKMSMILSENVTWKQRCMKTRFEDVTDEKSNWKENDNH